MSNPEQGPSFSRPIPPTISAEAILSLALSRPGDTPGVTPIDGIMETFTATQDNLMEYLAGIAQNFSDREAQFALYIGAAIALRANAIDEELAKRDGIDRSAPQT